MERSGILFFQEIDQGLAKADITVIFRFSASGETTPHMIIYPYRRIPSHITATVPGEWGIGVSDNGWVKYEIIFEYTFHIFYPHLKKLTLSFPSLLCGWSQNSPKI